MSLTDLIRSAPDADLAMAARSLPDAELGASLRELPGWRLAQVVARAEQAAADFGKEFERVTQRPKKEDTRPPKCRVERALADASRPFAPATSPSFIPGAITKRLFELVERGPIEVSAAAAALGVTLSTLGPSTGKLIRDGRIVRDDKTRVLSLPTARAPRADKPKPEAPPPADEDEPPARPTLRGQCLDGPRPCPYVGCRHHLFLDVKPNGTIQMNFPSPDQMTETCALDVADRGGERLDVVGVALGVSRERVRQIEQSALIDVRRLILGGEKYS